MRFVSNYASTRFEDKNTNTVILSLCVLPLAIYFAFLLIFFPTTVAIIEIFLNAGVILWIAYEYDSWDKNQAPIAELPYQAWLWLAACGVWASYPLCCALLGVSKDALPNKKLWLAIIIHIITMILLAFLIHNYGDKNKEKPISADTTLHQQAIPQKLSKTHSFTNDVTQCRIVLADFSQLYQAQDLFSSLPSQQVMQIVETQKGRFAVISGTMPIAQAAALLQQKIQNKTLPSSAYCIKEAGIVRQIPYIHQG